MPNLRRWSDRLFVTCIECGEIFVIDLDNSEYKNLSINEIAGNNHCPICNSDLKSSIKKYPDNIKLPDGIIGSYIPTREIPKDEETLEVEFFEIRKNSN